MMRPARPCTYPACGALVRDGSSRCPKHKHAEKRMHDKHRPTSTQRGYNSRWRAYREAFLAEHPLCVECERHERLSMATVVDHIIPHKGDMELFWRVSNHQALCKSCHDRKTATFDHGFGNGR